MGVENSSEQLHPELERGLEMLSEATTVEEIETIIGEAYEKSFADWQTRIGRDGMLKANEIFTEQLEVASDTTTLEELYSKVNNYIFLFAEDREDLRQAIWMKKMQISGEFSETE